MQYGMHVPHLSWKPDLDELSIVTSGSAEEGFKSLFLDFQSGAAASERASLLHQGR